MKSLIIYFSRKGNNYSTQGIKFIEVGNTEVIAKYIEEFTDGDIFEVETVKDYPADYMECTEVAQEEIDENARPELKKYLDDISGYDTIYVGCPNWWGRMPMAMYSLLERLDFTGKTIKPFVTHEGGGMGSAERELKNLCEGAQIERGLSIRGSNVDNAKSIVKDWI
ncbi:MAG: NAD(P)H-dependent oxidoreductase [Methanobacteriaceae archaeon]|nr:NAD(P)H-dependent oxidoreductase [Methanobacteriaceae archaeon]